MKNPLHYQMTEYDCGPTSLMNAVSFLFEREKVPPELIRNIMLYCLDCYGEEGSPGKRGTSRAAMMFLSSWLDGFGKTGKLPISSRYLSGSAVNLREDGELRDALHRQGAAVVRLYSEVPHYVLFTGITEEAILLFDPYYEETIPETDVTIVLDHPTEYNRIVPFALFDQETEELYSLGKIDEREAILLFDQETELTDEKTIEYFI